MGMNYQDELWKLFDSDLYRHEKILCLSEVMPDDDEFVDDCSRLEQGVKKMKDALEHNLPLWGVELIDEAMQSLSDWLF